MYSLFEQAQKGTRVALARLISNIENRDPQTRELIRHIYPLSGRAKVFGITGPPGAGKSTLVDALVARLRCQFEKIAIVAVDPSSPFSGGSILGDRIRMSEHTADDGVFIRSMGTRGRLGGLARATQEVVLLLDALGFDPILVETAGVGQTELSILEVAHTVALILVPESGDSIQIMKAGVMEIADILIVNKSDRPQADLMVKELVSWVDSAPERTSTWKPPVLRAEALRKIGVDEIAQALLDHHQHLIRSKEHTARFERILKSELMQILIERFSTSLERALQSLTGRKLWGELMRKEKSPYEVLDTLFPKL